MLRIQHGAFGGAEARGGLLLVGDGSPGGEQKGFELNHGQGQLHLFGFQVRPHVFGAGSRWGQGEGAGDPPLKGAVVRLGRRWRGGVGFLSEGRGRGGRRRLCGFCRLLLFDFCWRVKRTKGTG